MNTQKNKITLLNDELIPLSECNYNRVSESQKREQEHQNDFREFGYKNPSVSEISFVKRRIRLIEEVIKESDKTADDIAGEEMDGMEFINGIMTKTKFGTAADLSSWERELEFLELKKESLINPVIEIKESKKTLSDFIHNVRDKEEFLSDLVEKFKMERGNPIKAVINILKDAELIIIPDRQFQTFFNLLKSQFKTNIGTYTSVNDAEKNKGFDETLKKFQIIVKPLIIKHKIK